VSDEQVPLLPGSPSVNICYECLDLCNGMIAEERVWREALRHLNVGRELQEQESCLACSFCGKSQDGRKLIAGSKVYICVAPMCASSAGARSQHLQLDCHRGAPRVAVTPREART
jgi:ATP-dependent protease Clp ATPase subunit